MTGITIFAIGSLITITGIILILLNKNITNNKLIFIWIGIIIMLIGYLTK